jgi:hypothetical protein
MRAMSRRKVLKLTVIRKARDALNNVCLVKLEKVVVQSKKIDHPYSEGTT